MKEKGTEAHRDELHREIPPNLTWEVNVVIGEEEE